MIDQKSGSVLMSRQGPLPFWAARQPGRKRSAIWDSSLSTTSTCCCLSVLLIKDLHPSHLSGFELQGGKSA